MVRFFKINDAKLSAFLEDNQTLSLRPVYPIHSLPKDPIMRSYPRNSPEAAVRILALVHLSDGETAMIQAIRGIWQTSPVKAGAVKAEINFPALAHAG
jgi:hypothetical protein